MINECTRAGGRQDSHRSDRARGTAGHDWGCVTRRDATRPAGETATTLPHQIAINVAFEEQVVKFWREVVYSSPKNWGLLVGVRFNRQPAAVRDFLFRRYVC